MPALPTPPALPIWVEAALWSALVAWVLFLGARGRQIGSAELAMSLCIASFPLTAAVIAATEAWQQPQARSFIRLILWMAVALGLSGVVMWLHHRSDEPRSDRGGEPDPEPPVTPDPDPDPPWWPDFEREFRDYARRGPRQPVS